MTNEEKAAVDQMREWMQYLVDTDAEVVDVVLTALQSANERADRAEAALREKELADLRGNTCENCGCSV